MVGFKSSFDPAGATPEQKKDIANFAYPTNNIITTSAEYNAPATGFAIVSGTQTAADNASLNIVNQTTGVANSCGSWIQGFREYASVPAKKGDRITTGNSRFTNVEYKFAVAQG